MTSIVESVPTATAARALTDRIKVAVEGTWLLITEAYTSRAWSALGYTSWDDYCTREFGTSRLRLPREERQEVVSSLREQGLSLRAIEAVTGVSRPTVISDLRAGDTQVVKSLPPYKVGPGGLDDAETPEPVEVAESEGVTPEPAKVTGTDGKAYPATKPDRAPYRKPLPDFAKDAGWELRKAMERVERIFDDNRYQQNEEQVAIALRGHLLYIAETVAAVLDQLS